MKNTSSTTIFSGRRNRGFQLGSNSGYIQINIHEASLANLNPSSTVPFRRDPDFVDRDILAEVLKKCSKPASRAALVGLGGVGKSQIAIEYSYRIRERFPQTWIFWVHASNAARFEEGYRMIADRIKLPRRDKPATDILQLVSNWLCDEANGRWIMILDNADDLTLFSDLRKGKSKSDINGSVGGGVVSLSKFLPQTPNGSILVTSRSQDAALSLIGRQHDIIKVEPMDQDRALQLFEKKLLHRFDKGDAIELLQVLDYMPLAISQTAAYISQRAPRITVASYLDQFRKSDRNRANLLNCNAIDLWRDSEASNSIITTWQLSFEYIRNKRPSAARLLSLMSFFDRHGIPESLLRFYDDRENDSNISLDDIDLEAESELNFQDDLLTLINYSLITTNVKNDQFEMHRLVQYSTREWLKLNNELERWKEKYIRIISVAFPRGAYENWTTCQVMFPHAKAVLAYRPAERSYLIYWSEILNNAGWYALKRGIYSTAEEMYQQALDAREKALGKEHPKSLTSFSNLAEALFHQGKYKVAEKMNRRALNTREKALGEEHLDTLTSVHNLAQVLRLQGEYKAAEEMSQRALDGRKGALGKEHPETLASINNLATVLLSQGKYEAAVELNQQVLDGREKALGKEHHDTLMSVNNLGISLGELGKYEAEEEMHRRALDGTERTLGKEHPHTLICLNNLACVLQNQRKYKAAERMYRRALDGRERTLGKEHPDTLSNVSGLASVLQDRRKYKAAERMYRRALDGTERTLGKEHPDTLSCVDELALVLGDLGKYEAAEKMHRRALDGMERACRSRGSTKRRRGCTEERWTGGKGR